MSREEVEAESSRWIAPDGASLLALETGLDRREALHCEMARDRTAPQVCCLERRNMEMPPASLGGGARRSKRAVGRLVVSGMVASPTGKPDPLPPSPLVAPECPVILVGDDRESGDGLQRINL